MGIKIITDSSTDLISSVREKVEVVPLTIFFGEEEFSDGVTIDHETFYKRLVNDKELPKTSQAAPDAFAACYEKARRQGDDVLVITVSSELSGTYQSAMIAAQDYDNVHVVDGRSVAIGTGLIVMRALSLVEEGMSAAEAAEALTLERDRVKLFAIVDTLEYLRRGGRLSRTAAIAGGLLNIKPIIGIRNGALEVISKARGSKQANAALKKEMEAISVDTERPFMLGYTGLNDSAVRQFASDACSMFGSEASEIPITIVGSTVGTHAGPGAVACAFFGKE